MATSLNNEEFATKVAGIFDSKDRADNAFSSLSEDKEFEQSNIEIISAHDQRFDEKIEPEDKNIGKTLLKTHLLFGVLGLGVGLIISSVFLFIDVEFMQSFVLETYAGVSTVCIFIALLVAGFVSIRPDHDPLINEVRNATRSGKWVLVVHTDSHKKGNKAKELIKPFATNVTATF
ncbi:hypothetical protein [Pseudoalteromonas sp. ZZD1]|uniref:hypothetical protein n=1 Tax=Pseudoalteromonas sp. ZZD1 TaxID=3139395 RepID=UPI003BA929D4